MTFSLVLAVPRTGLLVAATASRSLGVGNAVPAVRPGVGAVVSQAWTNRSLRGRVLDVLATGYGPTEALARIPNWDHDHRWRQVGVVDAVGAHAAHTGPDCSAWAGSCAVDGPAVSGVVVANLVTGAGVVEAAAATAAAGDPADAGALASLALEALLAGQRAGGDRRGQQSAALVVGSGEPQDWSPPDLDVDLRVDDDPEPLAALERLLRARTG
ncbi:DUF1028 domain-containing protein [Nocardioides aestuarii]|uniref:DUF1028 domain-containing protein n=1 Tax=Nocardioides aestuarii TaxID=252231 RepID=A0ABW4TQ54_9ACTN